MRWERVQSKAVGGGPGKRWGHTCNAIMGGRLLYVFGGYVDDGRQTNEIHVFDTVSQTWSTPQMKGTLPSPRDSHTCTAVGNNLFVFGGTDGTNPLKDLYILDTASNTWISPKINGKGPDAREGHSATLIGTKLFIFGGCGKSRDNPEDIYYNDLYFLDTENLIWNLAVTSGAIPSARDSHTCSSWKNKLIILGGEDVSDYYLSDVYLLDTDTFVWNKLNTSGQLLEPRAGHSTMALGKYLFVFGGFADDRNLYDDLHILNLETGVWTKVLELNIGPSARFSAAGDCLDAQKGILVVLGGCNASLEALDDMYFLHTGFVEDETFEAIITSVFHHGYTIETKINGKLLRGVLFLQQPNSTHYIKKVRLNGSHDVLNEGAHGVADNMKVDSTSTLAPINMAENCNPGPKTPTEHTVSCSNTKLDSISEPEIGNGLE